MKAGMIALLPADPAPLALDGKSAIQAGQIHLTLAYLGDDVTGWDQTRRQLLQQAVWSIAHTIGTPIHARVVGHATFNPDGGPVGDREPCAVHLIGDTDRLAPAREHVDKVCATLLGEDYPTQHAPFLPHVTAGEGLAAADLTFTGPVVFDSVVLALGDDWHVVPITTSPGEAIAPYARTSFAQGWSVSGGPMTDRVKAGCVAAVELAVANAAHPGILEATLRLGSLEGTWALVYQRREALVDKHLTQVTAAWRHAAHRLDVRAAVRRYRHSIGLGESVDTDNTDHRRMVANAIATTVASAIAGQDATPADREAVISATADALADAEAEGYTAAVLVGAEQLGVTPPAADTVLTDYQSALADLGSHWADASGWVGRMVQVNATDLGGRLSQMVVDGASFDEMTEEAADIIGGDDIRAVSTLLDLAMGQSFSRGALALYGREGVTQVDFVTAGTRVCPRCQDIESNNPWDRNAVPAPPIHPYCVIGSTRVSAASVSGSVPEHVPVRHPLSYSAIRPGCLSDSGPVTATAMAEPEGDFGRSNLRAVTVRDYVGDLITISTATGKELTGTPNHPVATRNGWVCLAELSVGDHVLCSTRTEWVMDFVNPDVDHVPPTIEEVAETFSVAFGPMPTSPQDFHGDGTGSQVHVVRTDRCLVNDGQTMRSQHGGEFKFSVGHSLVDDTLVSPGPRGEFSGGSLSATDCGVSGGSDPGSFLRCGLGHSCVHTLATASGSYPGFQQPGPDRPSGDAECLTEGQFAFAGEVTGNDDVCLKSDTGWAGNIAVAADFHSQVGQFRSEASVADTQGFCESLEVLTSDITSDNVVHVERFSFRGHVYNLDTVDGWYVSNGIVSHNCRCNLQATDPMQGLTALLSRLSA